MYCLKIKGVKDLTCQIDCSEQRKRNIKHFSIIYFNRSTYAINKCKCLHRLKDEMNPQTLNINSFEIAKFFIWGKLFVTKDVPVNRYLMER